MKTQLLLSLLIITMTRLTQPALEPVDFVPLRSGLEPKITVRIDPRRGWLVFEWVNNGTLQFAGSMDGLWKDVEGAQIRRHVVPLADATEASRFFRINGVENSPQRPAQLQVPDGYTTAKKYPLILNLHGFTGTPEEL